MKLDSAKRNVEASGIQETNQFRIEMNAASIDILSSKIYSNAFLAIVRELACNAWDAHVAAGTTETPFEIWFPHSLKSEFRIRDYGTGLSHDDVMYLYTTYFGSNKRDTNTMIGGLGLGSKTPYAYTSAFSVRSFFEGTVSEYAAYKDKEGIPVVSLVNSQPSDEPPGIEVAVPVIAGDEHRFINEAQKALEWFPTTPKTYGKTLDPVDWETQVESCGMRKNGARYGWASVVMGNVSYSLNMSTLAKHTTFKKGLSSMAKSAKFVLFADIGELTISASREELNYNEHTIDRLIKKLELAYADFVTFISKGIEKETTLAGKYYWRSKLPAEIREAIQVETSVEIPEYIDARAVDAYTWNHETGIKTSACSHMEMRGELHPAILIAEARTTAFKKIVENNNEFHPTHKGRGGRSYYSGSGANRDVYILWRPLEKDDPDGALRKNFDTFLKLHFDNKFVYSSQAYPQHHRTVVSKSKGTYVKPSARRRKIYTTTSLPVGRNKNRWQEFEEALNNIDLSTHILVGFSSFEPTDYDTGEAYATKLIGIANVLLGNHTFLGVPKAAWKTAKKQGFLTLPEFVEQKLAESKRTIQKEDYVMAIQRDKLRRDHPTLVKFMEHSGIWERNAPTALAHTLCEKFKPLQYSCMQEGSLEDKIRKIESQSGERLFELTPEDLAMYDKNLAGADEWLKWAYPKLVEYMTGSSWIRIDKLACHYINCIEGINE